MVEPTQFIPTVMGPIEPRSLGVTLMHEHLLVDWSRALHQRARPVESPEAIDRILSCVQKGKDAGVTALVDVGFEAYGPSPLLLQLAARITGIHVICSTGVFETDQLPAPSWAYPPSEPEDIAQHFIAAATHGIWESGLKPGVIKVANSPRAITELEENVLRAAAAAQRQTGLAITTHTRTMALALTQIDILEDAGADLDRVVIGHIGWTSGIEDLTLHTQIAERGVFIALDCVGQPCRSNDEYVRIACDLIDAGFEDQMVFGHDAVAYVRGIEGVYDPEWFLGDFTVVTSRLAPLLIEKGVSETTINKMLIDNPRRALTIDAARYPSCLDTTLARNKDAYFEWMGGRIPSR
jgi:phosphotriesterase-related protein